MTKKEKKEKARLARAARTAAQHPELPTPASAPTEPAPSHRKERTSESLDTRWAKCIAKFPPIATKFPTDQHREDYIAAHK